MGAWIETQQLSIYLLLLEVAPFMGAWIETRTGPRGDYSTLVAPFMGAWIETALYVLISSLSRGRAPQRARGLKRCVVCH